LHYRSLVQATAEHEPDVVAIVGDALYALGRPGKYQFTAPECATILSELPVEHLIFVRGNHEDSNWSEFVASWPHERRSLTALYGTSCSLGPLVVVGFPCLTGSEFHWCAHLPDDSNTMELLPVQNRKPLASDPEVWLPILMRRLGPAGRTLWLMHESPIGLPLANPRVFNPVWTNAVERFFPKLVIAGHDHDTPLQTGIWQARCGTTLCVNVGQAEMDLHYTVLDFEFADRNPSLPSSIKVRAFPSGEEAMV
jgi:hypothetical protein